MINVNIDNQDFLIKSSLEEFTLNEFCDLTIILSNDTMMAPQKWTAIIEYLGIPFELLEKMEITQLGEIVQELSFVSKDNKTSITEFEHNGYKYELSNLKDGKLSLSTKEYKFLTDLSINNKNDFIIYALAFLFRRIDLSDVEHYSNAHIDHKVQIFKDELIVNHILTIGLLTDKLISINNTMSSNFEDKK